MAKIENFFFLNLKKKTNSKFEKNVLLRSRATVVNFHVGWEEYDTLSGY